MKNPKMIADSFTFGSLFISKKYPKDIKTIVMQTIPNVA